MYFLIRQVLVWNSKMELGATFNASTMGPVKNSISSICYDALTSKVLVTFQTCEVFEMDGTDGRYAPMCSHLGNGI